MNDLIVARVVNPFVCSPPWVARTVVPEGELVLACSADNLPENSDIRWWLHPIPGSAEKDWHDYAESAYGIGAGKDDLEQLLDIGNELHKLGVEVYS